MTSAHLTRRIAACARYAAQCAHRGDDEYARNWAAAHRAAVAERDLGCFFVLDAAREREKAQRRAQA